MQPLSSTLSLADRSAAEAARPVAQLFFGMACDRPAILGPHVVLDGLDGLDVGRGAYDELAPGPGRISALRLADGWMSTRHAQLRKDGGGWILRDAGSKNGCFVAGQKVSELRLADGALITLGQTLFIFRDSLPRPQSAGLPDLPGFRTRHPLFQAQLARIPRVAGSKLAVMLHGETGTGKELMARAIHELSNARGAFVPVNCAALPAGMLEGELFGYRKGAFSGAQRDHLGLIRAADGGTLFLDEIGDLAPPAQAALLRALQEHEVLPLGETRAVPVDFRLVAATHHDLDALVDKQGFRRDLHARIADFVLELPALRERREDLGLLVGTLLAQRGRADVRLELDAAMAVFRYEWPSNVRELERALSAALVLADTGVIGKDHWPAALRAPAPRPSGRVATPSRPPAISAPLDDDNEIIVAVEPTDPADIALRDRLLELLRLHEGNLTAVAREMGKDRTQIRRWLRRFGIDVDALRR